MTTADPRVPTVVLNIRVSEQGRVFFAVSVLVSFGKAVSGRHKVSRIKKFKHQNIKFAADLMKS